MSKKNITILLIILAGTVTLFCRTPEIKKTSNGKRIYPGDKSRISAQSTIEGYVRDAQTGKGIENARVEIKNANMGVGYYLIKTNRRGYFKIENFIPYIQYIIEVTAENYVTYTSKKVIAEGKQDIRLQPEAIITGIVKDSSGSPMKNIQVKLKPYGGPGKMPVITRTGGNGSYTFNKLKRGRYLVTFTREGYITETAKLKNVKSGEIFRLPMIMVKPAAITGTIQIAKLDTPAVNVNITARGRVNYTTSTYQDGTYRLEDLKPGKYNLTVFHQGFNTLKSSAITVIEGATIDNVNFTIVPKKPKLRVYSYRYTFVPGNKLEFNLRTFRLESVTVSVYKVPMGALLQGGSDPDKIDPGTKGFRKISSWIEPVRDFQPYKWRYQALKIKKPLPTGGYCIEVKGAGRIVSRKYFTVTSVGVIIKRTPGSVFAYVTNLVTNKPIPNAKLALFSIPKRKKRGGGFYYKPPKQIEDLPVRILYSGATDANGIYHLKKKTQSYLTALAVGPDGSYAICNTGSPSTFQRERVKYFTYTDRPVYRAGDTVFYKIIGKKRANRFIPTSGNIYYKVINRDVNKVLEEGSLTLDQWGTAHGKIAIPGNGNLGTHQIRVGPSPDNLYSRGTFYVEQYRKPEFKIDITPSRDYFINGDTAEFKVEAKYFFGAPLKGALVQYRFYETRLRDSDNKYWWEEGYQQSRSYNRLKLDGEKYVNKDGIAVLRVHAGNYPYDREITLEATVVDKSNVSITARKKVRIGRGEFYIKIQPEKHFYSDSEKKRVVLRAFTHTGKPVKTRLKVQLFRYIWKPWQRVYVHDKKPLFAKNITTDRKGYARIELPEKFQYTGEFDLIAEGVDRRDNVITASRVIWIYNRYSRNVASKFKNLELALNRTSLERGGEITCLMKSRYTDSYVCLTLEGRDVYESRVVKMDRNIVPVTFRIKPEYAPNLYITATMQRQRALYTVTRGVSIPVKSTSLDLSISTDRKTYLPGESSTITLKATGDDGKLVEADISLAIVDEAIYQIRRDHTPRMQDYFYTKISNWVMTSYSYPITILAGAGKEGKVKVRENFKDTAYWKARIRTGPSGIARVTAKLPDNLTTWRITARGHDTSGRVGETKNTFIVTQDLIARIGKPRFFIEEDEIGLIGIVNSNTKRGMKDIKTEFSINKTVIQPDTITPLSLPAFGSARNYYTYSVPADIRNLSLQFTAVSDRDASDSLRVTVPVERRGVPYKLFGIGNLSTSKKITVEPLKISDKVEFQPENVTVSITPSPVIQMIRATEFLSKYPYGCVEQTLNRFIPALALHKILEKKGYGRLIDAKAKQDLPGKVRAGLSRIHRFQNADGTWGWWYGDRGNGFVTGYVLQSLSIAKDSGYPVDVNRVNRGLTAVKRMLMNRNLTTADEYCYLFYIYSHWNRWEETAFKEVQGIKNPNPYQLSFIIRGLSQAGRQEKLAEKTRKRINGELSRRVAQLKAMLKRDEKGVYWESQGAQRWSWPGGRTEMTAHVLKALLDAGDTSSLPSQVVQSLSARSRGGAWTTTKQTSAVILALCSYIDAVKGKASLNGDVDLLMDGKKIADFQYSLNKNGKAPQLEKRIELTDSSRQNTFNFEVQGTANPDMTYNVTVSGTLYFNKKGFLSFFGSEEKALEKMSNGLQVTKSYSALTRVNDRHQNEYLVPQALSDRKSIHIGDEILVTVKFIARDSFKYLVLEDYLPSGFEVTKKNAYNGYRPYVHVERWDNRMVYFFTGLEKGEKYEVAYIIRAELPGTFMVKPARLECMYEPTIQGWSAPGTIEVQRKE